jgi:hypothetical protein
MVKQLVLLVVGFVLTTVAGGLVAAVLQHRSWRYKWDTENSEKNISTSRELFQEISRLMDRRLYRVDQFYLSARICRREWITTKRKPLVKWAVRVQSDASKSRRLCYPGFGCAGCGNARSVEHERGRRTPAFRSCRIKGRGASDVYSQPRYS